MYKRQGLIGRRRATGVLNEAAASSASIDDGRAVLVGGGSSVAIADVSGEGSSALVRLGDGAIPKRAEMC